MDNNILEKLLNEDESTSLDFKRDQYLFEGATDDEKSELVKDILAFTNSWRRTTAYILIGVEEVKGGRSIIRGADKHLDDAKLQQFVNSKVQQPVEFSYQAYTFEGHQIGIIEIPLQTRPNYLLKNYGKLEKEKVYIKRGSSTDIAKPDEIAKMGTAVIRTQPNLELQFANIDEREVLGCDVDIYSLNLDPILPPSLFEEPKQVSHWPIAIDVEMPGINKNYYFELIEYIKKHNFLDRLGFVLFNNSGVTAKDVRLVANIPIQQGIVLEESSPRKPSKNIFINLELTALKSNNNLLIPKVNRYSDFWVVSVCFGNILPKETVWSSSVLNIGGNNSQEIEFEAELYSESLSDKIKSPMRIRITTETRPMKEEDVLNEIDETD